MVSYSIRRSTFMKTYSMFQKNLVSYLFWLDIIIIANFPSIFQPGGMTYGRDIRQRGENHFQKKEKTKTAAGT